MVRSKVLYSDQRCWLANWYCGQIWTLRSERVLNPGFWGFLEDKPEACHLEWIVETAWWWVRRLWISSKASSGTDSSRTKAFRGASERPLKGIRGTPELVRVSKRGQDSYLGIHQEMVRWWMWSISWQMASTPEVYEGRMGEKRKGARLGIKGPGAFTRPTNTDLGQDPACLTFLRQGEQNHLVALWSK
jgi:hypothetical protein